MGDVSCSCAVAVLLPVAQGRGEESACRVHRRMGTKEEIALRAQKVVDQLADRTGPIDVSDVEEMVHTITNNITSVPKRLLRDPVGCESG